MKLLDIEMPLKDLEKIYNEFAKKMEEVVNTNDAKTARVVKKVISIPRKICQFRK